MKMSGKMMLKRADELQPRVGENGVEAERAARNAENYQGKTSGGFNIAYLQFLCQSHVTSNICKDINEAYHRDSSMYTQHQHSDENCKRSERGAFRARVGIVGVEIFLSFPQWMCSCVRLACIVCCLRTLRLQLNRQQFPMVSVLRLFRGLYLRGGANPSRSLPW